jgi:hypothetical protein
MILAASPVSMDNRVEPFTDEQALIWLLALPDGRIETTVSDLARRWSWNRTKVLRRLRRWTAEGHIIRTHEPGGRSVITAMNSTAHRATSANTTALTVATSESRMAAVNVPVHLAEQGEHRRVGPLPARGSRAIFRTTASVGFAALALAIAWFGIRINAWYGATLGKTEEASSLIAGLSVSADILALGLPAAARTLWVERCRAAAAVAWALWTVTIVVALMATIGFTALNIADTTAARDKIAGQSTMLRATIDRLRGERALITESRSVATIEAELQRAQPGAAAVWRATAGCRDVTVPESGQACATVLALRQALGTAERRDRLDADLREASSQLERLPAVTTADPQAETAAKLVHWATFGVVNLTSNDIQMARVAGIALMPQIAGLVLMLATTLWQSGQARAPR